MKIYKYTAMAMSANIDPYLVYNNIYGKCLKIIDDKFEI